LSPRLDPSKLVDASSEQRLTFNADVVAIALALAFAALVRFNVIHHIGW
jgi:hypothetical protein